MVVDHERAVLTATEVAELLRLSMRTTYRLLSTGEIRATRLAGQYRIPVGEVERLLGHTVTVGDQ